MLYSKQKGFTLIELLVVVAIIGILSTIVLVSLNEARAKARDVRRLADLRQMALALEFYYDDNNAYIDSSGSCIAVNEANMGDLTTTYMSNIPNDPMSSQNYSYGSDPVDGQEYVLQAIMEGTVPDASYPNDEFGCSCDQLNEYCLKL